MTKTDAEVRVQQTLDGGTTAEPRERPDTWNWCHECEDWILRSQWLGHKEHSEEAAPKPDGGDGGGDDEDDEDDEPRHVADEYRVEFVYEKRYTVNLIAADERSAKKRAKELHREGESMQSGGHHLVTNTDKGSAVYEDDERMEEVPGWPW